MLRDGRLHLSGIRRLAPHLTRENRDQLLKRATHKSRREIEELVAELAPRPDAPSRIRKLPQRRPPAAATTLELGPDPVGGLGVLAPLAGGMAPTPGLAPEEAVQKPGHGQAWPERQQLSPDSVPGRAMVARKSRMEPLALARYKIEFTADAVLRDQLERLQALMRASVPDGNLGTLIKMAVAETVERLEARRFAKTKRPRNGLAMTDSTSQGF